MGGYDKKDFAKNLSTWMTITGTTPTDLCELLGVTKSSVSCWINAQKMPRMDKIQTMADHFGIQKSELLEKKLPDNIIPLQRVQSVRQIPLLGRIACGEPILAEENIEEYIVLPNRVKADFALTAKGDSMIDAHILDGDIVYIRQQDMVENGEIAAVLIDEEATLKRVRFYEDSIVLFAENKDYPPTYIRRENMNQVRILGKLTAVLSVRR